MVQEGDMLELTMQTSYQGSASKFLNVFHYQHFSGGPMLLDGAMDRILEAFEAKIVAPLQEITVTAYWFEKITVQNLENPDEFASVDFADNTTGGVGTDPLPSWNTWSFILNRSTRQTRNGQKRFSGVPEQYTALNQPTGDALPFLDDIADGLWEPLTIEYDPPLTGDWLWLPYIVRKTAQFTYTNVNRVQTAQFTRIGTQNTRKR